MAYTVTDFRSKKALKEAVKAGETVRVYQPGPFGPTVADDDRACLEGPHYPKPHSWYATAVVKDGVVVKVVS